MATDPICGMYVDERSATLRLIRDNRTYYFCAPSCLEQFSHPEHELRSLRLRLAVAWPLAALAVVCTYLRVFPDQVWVAFAAATVVQLYPGLSFYRGTWNAARSRLWNMDVLIAVGTTVAYGYSAAVVLLPGRLPPAVYFDTSSVIVALILTGNYLEHLVRDRARGSLRELQALLPTQALVLREGKEVELPVPEVKVDDVWVARPGGRFPTDGVVVEGTSSTSEALLTGESELLPKGPGDRILAGGVNGDGRLKVRANRVGDDTLLAQVSRLVAEAETSQVPLQRLADRIASVFVPFVLSLALIVGAAWVIGGVGVAFGLLAFVSVAITACPCAFGIATPAALVVGTGRAAEEGILFQGRDALERASTVDTVLFDKTGTLTQGRPILERVQTVPPTTEEEALRLSASLELGSDHPFARSVVTTAHARGLSLSEPTKVQRVPGGGLEGQVDGRVLRILSLLQAKREGLDLGTLRGSADRAVGEGLSCSVVLGQEGPLALLAFSERLAPGAEEAVEALRRRGLGVQVVTGDHEQAARRVGKLVGIDQVHAGVTPAQKLDLIRELQRQGHHVAFVGDGINDAPALAASDLGVAVGAGSDVAKEAGSVVLIRADLRGVPLALQIGRRTVSKVKGNLTWAVGYNVVLLPVAAGVLVPVLGLGILADLPFVGALAMAFSSTTVVLNSLSLRWISLEPMRKKPASSVLC